MKRIIPLIICAAIVAVLAAPSARAETVTVTALQGKATLNCTPDTVISESRLKTRSATNGNKSWLQFDLTAIYAANPGLQGNITSANLTFWGTGANTSAKSYVVSGLLDSEGLEGWDATTLTWNNAPANDTASQTGLLWALVYGGASLYTGNVAMGDAILTDVSSASDPVAAEAALRAFLNTDTNGLVTFALTPGGTTYLYNVGSDYVPVLTLTYIPEPATIAVLGLGGLLLRRRFA